MPTFKYVGPTENPKRKFMVTADGAPLELAPTGVSDPVDYFMVGVGGEPGPKVEGRQFEKDEHVHAHQIPDPSLFEQVD